MNRLKRLLIVSCLLPAAAWAATDDVCWNRDLERMDFYTNPPSRGDNTFFSFTVSGTANVTMIYPSTSSMKQLPISQYELRTQGLDLSIAKGTGLGCSNAFLNNADTSPSSMVVKGNWLNFFPPKWAMLRLAYKRLVNGPLLNPLREGIGTQNGAAGWFRLQKMLPQSCSGQGRPNQRIGSVDGVTYTNSSNPLAEM